MTKVISKKVQSKVLYIIVYPEMKHSLLYKNVNVVIFQSKRGSVEDKPNTIPHAGRNSPAPRRSSETAPVHKEF